MCYNHQRVDLWCQGTGELSGFIWSFHANVDRCQSWLHKCAHPFPPTARRCNLSQAFTSYYSWRCLVASGNRAYFVLSISLFLHLHMKATCTLAIGLKFQRFCLTPSLDECKPEKPSLVIWILSSSASCQIYIVCMQSSKTRPYLSLYLSYIKLYSIFILSYGCKERLSSPRSERNFKSDWICEVTWKKICTIKINHPLEAIISNAAQELTWMSTVPKFHVNRQRCWISEALDFPFWCQTCKNF